VSRFVHDPKVGLTTMKKADRCAGYGKTSRSRRVADPPSADAGRVIDVA